MLGHGRDESAPTPDGVFATYFVGVRCIINNPFATFWQSVSSRRGRFIVPAYTCSPTKRVAEMRVRWNEYTYLIMWKCVLGYGNTHFWLCKNTGTMNRSPTPAECSQPISWVSVRVSWNIRTQFRGRMQPIHGTFVAAFLFVRHIIIIYVTHHRNSSTTSS